MSCQTCNVNHQPEKCPESLRFSLDGTWLIPRIGLNPLEPVDLAPMVQAAETDTRMQLDAVSRSLVYTGEQASRSLASADNIPLSSIAGLIGINELRDVEYPLATQGDILSFDAETGLWRSYTVPDGTVVTHVGVDADGNLVKGGAGGGTPEAPDTVPLGGVIMWTGDVSAIPVSYRHCDGAAISRTVYADLYALIGTRYGAGDGSTTFNLPNTQTRVVTGLSSTDTQFNVVGKTGGAKTANLQHSHTVNSHNHNNGDVGTSLENTNHTHSGIARGSQVSDGQSSSHYHTYSRSTGNSSPGTNTALSNAQSLLQPYITLPYIMRVI